MIYEICTQTDQGLMRGNNEDAVAFDPVTGLGILADGMGGYNAGEVASGMAVDLIRSEMGRWLSQIGNPSLGKEVRRAMEICVDNANRAINSAAISNLHYTGMGTTLVVGVFQQNSLVLGHVGDSRCYRLRDGEFRQMTKDHSLLQEQIDAGLVTPEQAKTAANKNLVTRALGIDSTVLVEICEHAVVMGDTYLMCSDGLTDMVGDLVIAEILQRPGSLEQKAKQLIAAANEAGGRDNISVLLAEAKNMPVKRGFFARIWGE